MRIIHHWISHASLAPALYKRVRLLLNGMDITRLAFERLEIQPGESILDVGCGVGVNRTVIPRGVRYIGVDLDRRTLRYAARSNPQGAFLQAKIPRLPFRPKSFDKALVVNVFHHLAQEEADGLSGELARLVKGPLVIVDADPQVSNRFQRFLLSLDPGRYFKDFQARAQDLRRNFTITESKEFLTPSGSAALYLFKGRPP